ncbi:MAG TPA: 2-aminoethylphosphonate--pyruvate transaminase [Acidisphaera sp.]|nr:2-aminoethylphosphonate--pyruvate transaminase [Acidisphaera sp.]
MILLIPGPVTTHPEVKAALLQDIAPWDNDWGHRLAVVRQRLLALAGGVSGRHAALLLQGCGHFAAEAAVRTFVPRGGKVLVPITGNYAERFARLAHEAGRTVVRLSVGPKERASPAAVARALAADPTIGHVAMVYSETSSGIVHDIAAIGREAAALGRRTLVDAVSAFGALPLDIAAMPEADAVFFTSNKCLEGMPGLSAIVVDTARTAACAAQAESWSLDLADILRHGQTSGWGSFRFTPPAQVVEALAAALDRLDSESRPARLARYEANMRTLYHGVQRHGLTPCLPEAIQGPIVLNVHAPEHANWTLQGFVDALKPEGFVISNFHNTPWPSFRLGCIGAIGKSEMEQAVTAIGRALDRMGIVQRQAGTAQRQAA